MAWTTPGIVAALSATRAQSTVRAMFSPQWQIKTPIRDMESFLFWSVIRDT
jgi:hypothetical protein